MIWESPESTRTGRQRPKNTPCVPPVIGLPSAVVKATGNWAFCNRSFGNRPILMARGIRAPESISASAGCRVLGPMRLMEHAVSILMINSRRAVRQSVCGRRMSTFHSAHICVGSHLTGFAGVSTGVDKLQSGAVQTIPSGRSNCGTPQLWGIAARGKVPEARGRRLDGPAVPWQTYCWASASSALAAASTASSVMWTLLS